jgi:hypothetical protein
MNINSIALYSYKTLYALFNTEALLPFYKTSINTRTKTPTAMSLKKLFWLIPVVLFTACQNAERNPFAKAGSADVVMHADSTTLDAAGQPLTSPERKVIHTADFKCKVKNVFIATNQLESMVKSAGGMVQDSHVENSSTQVKTDYYTPDSLRQTQTYIATAMLTLRVPVTKADSVIQAIPGMVSFMEHRTLKQSDVTFQYLGNELKNDVGEDNGAATPAMAQARKKADPLEVQKYNDNRQEKSISRTMENMQLQDAINYTTITVDLSQPEQVFTQIIVNPEYVSATPFLLQCKAALYNGWTFVRGLVIVLMNLWPVLLIAGAIWIIYRNIKKRQPVTARR